MSELSDLYQEVILDHNRRPRNWGPMPDATRTAEGYNPLCGDRLKLHVKIDDDRIAAVSFEGSGCAISKASASLMTDAVKGRTLGEAFDLFDLVHQMLTTPIDKPVDKPHPMFATLGELANFMALHATMHAGQITIIRRSLGRPPIV